MRFRSFKLYCVPSYCSQIWFELIRYLFNITANWLFNFDEALNVLSLSLPICTVQLRTMQCAKLKVNIEWKHWTYITSLKLTTRNLSTDFYLEIFTIWSTECERFQLQILVCFDADIVVVRLMYKISIKCILKESTLEILFYKLTLAIESFKIIFKYTLRRAVQTAVQCIY